MEEVKWKSASREAAISAKQAVTKLVGMTTKPAMDWLHARDVECRTLMGQSVTADFREDRVNLTVEDDKITKVEVG